MMATITDYYKYAALATAAYVRMGDQPEELQTDGATFAIQANEQSDGRLPLSIAQYLFDPPPGSTVTRWTIAHYFGSDNVSDSNASESKSGFAATLFQKDGENGLAVRGMEPIVNFTGITRDLITLTVL